MSVETSLRQLALEQLYLKSFPALWSAASSNPALLPGDTENLAGAVRRLMDRYDGSEDDADAFTAWAVSIVIQPGVESLAAFYAMRAEYADVVRAAIWKVLKRSFDLGGSYPDKTLGTVGEIEQEVWVKVFLDLDRWNTPGYSTAPGRKPAKLSTRLYTYALDQARGWQTEQIRRRGKDMMARNVLAKVTATQREAKGSKKLSLSELDRKAA